MHVTVLVSYMNYGTELQLLFKKDFEREKILQTLIKLIDE